MFEDLRTLKPYVRRYLGTYILGCICLITSNGLTLVIPWLIKQAIEHLQHAKVSEELARPYFFAALILVVASIQMVIRIGSRWFLLGNSRRVSRDMRNDLFAHLQKLSLSYYVRTPTGDLMSRAVNDMQYVQSLVGPVILYCTSTLLMYLGAVPVMLIMSPRLTLLALIPYPIFLLTFKKFAAALFARSRIVQERLADLSNLSQECISGIQIIKAYAQEESMREHFRELSKGYLESNIRLIKIHGLFLPMITSVTALGMLVVIWVGGRQVIAGQITLGDFIAFTVYLTILAMPTAFLGMIISASQRGLSSLQRINEIFNQQPSILDGPEVMPFKIEHGEIDIRNLSFSHHPLNNEKNGTFSLKNINLTVPVGTTVAIVGHTGSGKTTLINLIARLLELEPGAIWIDGKDITTIPIAEVRNSVSLVPQDSFLFSTTLRKNIEFGNHNGTGMSVSEAAQAAGLMPDIETFPKGFETIIGERGINLSGGQRQRVALARALVSGPKILILDDAFSSVDTNTEEQIMGNLKSVFQELTAIIVSHRMSTIKDADKIIVMDEGRIVEEGNHDSLIEKGGIYAKLYQRQLLMEELEHMG